MITVTSVICIFQRAANVPNVTRSLKGHQMLVMSRKPQQSITIKHPDGPIVVKIISTTKSQARMGVEAPASVNILRTEVLDKDLAEAKALPQK